MKKRKRKGLLGKDGPGEDVNPLDGVANLADVMLVFACGLMLALITYWNVDVAATIEQPPEQTKQELTETVTDLDDEEGEVVDSDALQEYGTVYIDKETGALYIISEDKG